MPWLHQGERVRASLETAFASVLRCTSYAGSPARKGRSLKRIPVLIVMVLVMLVEEGTERGVK